ncbi:hypothetical protein [Zavarzinella formosa]|uniref:hypothetical protein n=1 Tax=Zavarzinella formosa TaxID=360055 RepID=UPI0002D621D1|nr:hypothetical protein [Zavarzinella formosa]
MTARFVLAMLSGLSLFGSQSLFADEIHRNSFSGKTTSFLKGDDNVKAEVKVQELSADRSRSLPTSEHIKVSCTPGKNETNYAYFYYPTPAAPVTEDLSVSLWVHSNRAGVQLLARLVIPKERNPKQIDEQLTVTVLLDTYKAPASSWQNLVLKRPLEIIQSQKLALRNRLKRDIDFTDAYFDQLILNVYCGAGETDLYLDNLEIGPVKAGTAPPMPAPMNPKDMPPGKVVSKEKELPKNTPPANEREGRVVEFKRNKLTVDGVQIFPRFIRYSGTPLQVLKEAGFNGLYVPVDTPQSVIEDAIDNYGFWIIPYIPPVSETNNDDVRNPLVTKDVDTLVAAIRKFQSGDGVLFWDFGPVRAEDFPRVSRTVEAVRAADPKRPVGADVWDGFDKYANPLQLIGTHRDPLMTSLEIDQYSRWLTQRKILASGSRFQWTWIQTHIPEWQTKLLYDKTFADGFTEPIGPQPEQIRLLTYLALASGNKGIGYWSDKFLADSHQGRDRLLQIALLNQEIEMLEPLLLHLNDDIRWVPSSNKNVLVAILRTNGKGVLALPIWLGGGAQYVPPQGAIQNLTFTVPLVPDGAEPWEISPVRVQSLQNQLKQTPEGTQITLPEFDLTAAVVFTSDNSKDGLVAMWQKHTRRVSRYAASWAVEMADEEFRKVSKVHDRLCEVAPPLEEARLLLRNAEQRLMAAKRDRVANNDESAYYEALRSLRPLRILMRAQWDRATRALDYPAASIYAASYYTLPKHWELANLLRGAEIAASALNDGDFERVQVPDRRGVPIGNLPGWSVQEVALDEVLMDAKFVPAEVGEDEEPILPVKKRAPYTPTSILKQFDDPQGPKPKLGNTILRLRVSPKPVTLKKDEKAPPEPQALERVFLAVNSPPVRLTPGSWVRVTGWIKIPNGVRASADGVMFYDTSAGEAYSLRLNYQEKWKQFHFYRKVPSNGEIRVRMALTGFGTVYFDDIRVEPIVTPIATTKANPVVPPPMR